MKKARSQQQVTLHSAEQEDEKTKITKEADQRSLTQYIIDTHTKT